MRTLIESLETRCLLSAAADITSLTALRNDPAYSAINGSNIGVAILDTGSWAQHPDLKDNFEVYFDAVKNLASAAGDTNVADAADPDGHGTHVSGTAVSSNPDIGVATGAKLIAVRVLPADNEAEPSYDTVANGLQWVLNNATKYNIKVVNLSLGVPGVNDDTGRLSDQESAIIHKLENVGVTVVAAAGNDYADFAPETGASTPAAYSTLVVSNTWADTGRAGEFPLISGSGGNVHYFAQENDAAPDRLAATSQRSTLPGEVAAPGQDIYSTWNDPNKLYQYDSGTSMASPFITGTVALMQQAAFNFGGRYLTPAQVRTVLISSADTIIDTEITTDSRIPVTINSSGNAQRSGANQPLLETGLAFKRVDVYAAIKAVQALVTGQSTDQPPVAGVDPDATIATATTVPTLDGNSTYSFTGNVGTDGSVVVGASDVNVYALTLVSPGVVSAQLSLPTSTAAFDPVVRLFDSAGNELASVTGTTAGYPTLVSDLLTPGTYYLGISSAGNDAYTIDTRSGAANGDSTGGYTVTIGLANPDPNGVPQGAFVTDLTSPNATDSRTDLFSTAVTGSIGSDPNPLNEDGPRVQIGATDVDMFRLIAPDDGFISVDTLASSSSDHADDGVDTYLRVFDADFNPINASLSFFGTDAQVKFAVTRGTVYYVGVSAYGNQNYAPTTPYNRTSTTGQTGNYDAYFSFDNGDTNGNAYNAAQISLGQTVIGTIGADGGIPLLGADGGDKDVDFLVLRVQSAGLLDLTGVATSSGFSPILSLWRLSDDNNSIIRDADTTGRSPHIIAPVAAGETVYISVTGVGNDDFSWFATGSGSGGQTGTYTLTSALRPSTDLAKLTNSSITNGSPTPVTPGVPIYANLGTTNSVETGAASINLYSYTATYTGPLSIRVSVPGDQPTDPFLRLFSASGTELAYNDDSATGTRDAALTYNVVAGQTYYVGINPSSADARNYDPITGNGAAAGTEGDYILLLTVPARLALSAATVTQSAGGPTSIDFTLTLDSAIAQDVTADFTTYDVGGANGALAGTDYTPVTRTITIPAGQLTATVSVAFASNLTPGRTLLIGGSLTNLTNATSGNLSSVATVLPASPAAPSTTGPDLVATSLTLKPTASITPGDKLAATLTLTNGGVAKLTGAFSLIPVISKDAYFSSDDLALTNVKTVASRLAPGRVSKLNLSLKIPTNLEAGTWYIIALMTPTTTNDVGAYNNTVASSPITVQWLFGNVPGHKGKTLTLADAAGTFSTFSLKGPGVGTVTRDEANNLSITLSDTTAATTLNLTPTPKSAIAQLFNLTSDGPLKAILAPNVDLLGSVTTSSTPPTVRFHNR